MAILGYLYEFQGCSLFPFQNSFPPESKKTHTIFSHECISKTEGLKTNPLSTCFSLVGNQYYHGWSTSPPTYPLRNKAILRAYSPLVSLNKALLNPCFWGGRLTSHHTIWYGNSIWRHTDLQCLMTIRHFL